MSKMSYSEALGTAMKIRMREDPRVMLFGEDVGIMGGTYGVSQGMAEEFGTDRVRDTPISENAFVGCAVGAAATGLRPIAELMMGDLSPSVWTRSSIRRPRCAICSAATFPFLL